MKKRTMILVLAAVTAVSALIYADTWGGFAGDRLEPWKFQVVYTEKYFEYDTFRYADESLLDKYYLQTQAYIPGSMLSGIEHGFILRCGVTDGIAANARVDYISQKMESYNLNNPQSLSLFMTGYDKALPGIILGFRFPLTSSIPDDMRLIDLTKRMGLITGVFYSGNLWLIDYSGEAVYEMDLNTFSKDQDKNTSQLDVSASLGVNIYGVKERQKIDFIAEALFTVGARDYMAFKLVPQARMTFYNDFTAILGAEAIIYAQNAYLNSDDKLLRYTARIEYLINSDLRKVTDTAQVLSAPLIVGEPTPVPTATPAALFQITPIP